MRTRITGVHLTRMSGATVNRVRMYASVSRPSRVYVSEAVGSVGVCKSPLTRCTAGVRVHGGKPLRPHSYGWT